MPTCRKRASPADYPFILNAIHLTFSYFVTAVWYIFSARRKTLGFFMQPEEKIRRLIEGEVLGDSVRLAVMLFLSVRGKAGFMEVAEGRGLSAGRLTHHLKALEEKDYMRVTWPWEDLRARVPTLTP